MASSAMGVFIPSSLFSKFRKSFVFYIIIVKFLQDSRPTGSWVARPAFTAGRALGRGGCEAGVAGEAATPTPDADPLAGWRMAGGPRPSSTPSLPQQGAQSSDIKHNPAWPGPTD